jgi:hypothetical protein
LTLEGLSYTDRAVVCVCCCGDRGLTKIIENVTGIETMGHLCVPIEDSDFGLVTEWERFKNSTSMFDTDVFLLKQVKRPGAFFIRIRHLITLAVHYLLTAACEDRTKNIVVVARIGHRGTVPNL